MFLKKKKEFNQKTLEMEDPLTLCNVSIDKVVRPYS